MTQAHSPLKLMQQKKAECTRTKHDLLGLRSGESITLLPTLIGRSNLTGVEVAVAVAGRAVVEVGEAKHDLLGPRSGESITLLPTLIGRSNLTGVEVAVAVAGRAVVEVGEARYLVLLLFLELNLVFFGGGDGCILYI